METAANHKSLDDLPASWLRPDLRLEEKARRRPDKPAIIFGERIITYRELWDRVARLAAGLTRAGVCPGDRIACLTTNHPAFLETYFAASMIGAIFVPLNFRLARAELRFQIEDAGPSVLILGPTREDYPGSFFQDLRTEAPKIFRIEAGEEAEGASYEELLGGGPAPDRNGPGRTFSPEDPQLIMYTSGTTGMPKGALLPFRKTLFNSLNAQCFFELSEDDIVLIAVPLFHSLGLNILSAPVLFQGGTVVLLERFEPAATLKAIARHRVTFFGAVPTIYKRLLDHGLEGGDLSSLRFGFTAGAPIPVSVIEAYHRRGILLKQGFGQTESSILCCLDAHDAIRKAGSVGRPVVHAEVKVVNERFEEVAPGETGEIVARGPIVMLGYWRRAEETEKAFQGSWLRTQDLAVRDEEGFITLVGRTGEMYISGGENVYPLEIEKALYDHPAVHMCAVVGIPDEHWGEIGVSCIVKKPGVDVEEGEIINFLQERLASFKVPKKVVFLSELPISGAGKVLKRELKENIAKKEL